MKSENKTNDKAKALRAEARKKAQESAAVKKQKAAEDRRQRAAASAYRAEKKANIRKRSKKPKTLAEQRARKEKGAVYSFLSRYKSAFDLFMIPMLFFSGLVVYFIAVPNEKAAAQWCVQMSDSLFGAAGIIFFLWLLLFSARCLLGLLSQRFQKVPYGKFLYFLGLFLYFELVLQHNANKAVPPENPADAGGVIADAVDKLLTGVLGQAGTVILFVVLLLFFIWEAWRYLLRLETERGEPVQSVPIKVYWENIRTADEVPESQKETLHTDIEADIENADGLIIARKSVKQPPFSAQLKQKAADALKKIKDAFSEITQPLPEQKTENPFAEFDSPVKTVRSERIRRMRKPVSAAEPGEVIPEMPPERKSQTEKASVKTAAAAVSGSFKQPETVPEPEQPEPFPEEMLIDEDSEEGYEAEDEDSEEPYRGEFDTDSGEAYDEETPDAEDVPRKLKTAGEKTAASQPLFIPQAAAAKKSGAEVSRSVLPAVEQLRKEIPASEKQSPAVHSAPVQASKGSSHSVSFSPNLTQEAAQTEAEGVPQDPWILPDCTQILDPVKQYKGTHPDDPAVKAQAQKIERLLETFGAPSKVVEIQCGPTFSQFGVEPGFVERGGHRTRVRIKQIENLQKDLEMELSVKQLTIEAPIPGKTYVGVQVQNKSRTPVSLREVLENPDYHKRRRELGFALGKDINGEISSADLTRMPHLLIAGATGSGKSVCLNAILASLLMYNTPNQMKLILVDPKHVELSGYNGIPHLITPVVTDVEQVGNVLQWVLREMDMRNIHFMEKGVRNIQDYNRKFPDQKLPYIVIVIDELANLMMEAGSDIESSIVRLAQTARAMGIHLIVATQRPSRDVLTGTIKGNLPTRIAFAVSSYVDSQVILDRTGAEKLFGKGDMYFLSTEETALKRLQGVYVSDDEIRRLVTYWQSNPRSDQQPENNDPDLVPVPQPVTQKVFREPALYNGMLTQLPSFKEEGHSLKKEGDSLYEDAVKLVQRSGRASANMLVSQMSIGFTRANKLLAAMENAGIIGPPNANPAIPREVLDYGKYGPANDGEKD